MNKQNPNIVHMDMDTFFVSVERLLDPKLNGRPVIVGGTPMGRGVVAGCSYEARAYGVHSAMPIRLAYRLCPNAVFLNGHYHHYAEYSRLVATIMEELAPAVEKSSVDEFYLDLSYADRLKGDAYVWASEIQKTVRGETTLPISFGLAVNKLVAKVATTQCAKKVERKSHRVIAGDERGFLAPFPIRALPGVGPVMEEELLRYDITTIGKLAQTAPQMLQRHYGKNGQSLVERANGIDHSTVNITREQKSYSREETLQEDTVEIDVLLRTLLSLASQLAQDLREAEVLTEKITLKLRYSDFKTVTKVLHTSWTNSDQDIYKLAVKLFKAIWTRRIRVRLLGIEASSLIDDLQPWDLFQSKRQDTVLHSVFDSLRERYGQKIIGYAPTVIAR